ncbi:AAA family ATPase [Candidatus Venteria ishoeyi]|uniref:AAA domain (Dynein-related subfamily) n=1 Tax=Candidatus Venteria ishoeyi TaxID=1899563 RepID=A0A1H6FBB2_9GAMM|nr:MoxR family ATPase [Candidatus Venteria ishoeyi]MDM8547313.1 MoxR family ATPase [Candidatus Venteria ishoeyi]SEH07377.1 AAA domain (dynein-related subfamily) [Candidatus Venteria ishoeyi]
MSDYQFLMLPTAIKQRVETGESGNEAPQTPTTNENLARRPLTQTLESFAQNANYFIPPPGLTQAINAAIATGLPLLLSGEPGSGKTQVAYYVAQQLQLGNVLHFQVKSDSAARDLFYNFDQLRYFQDSQFASAQGKAPPNKAVYLEPRPLWQAMGAKQVRIVLIDEIDKAPRDFANDLLYELDRMEFHIPELGKHFNATPQQRPLVFITTNSERRLPDPFLRRCIYHPLQLSEENFRQALQARRQAYTQLDDELIDNALSKVLRLRKQDLMKPPSLTECLVWFDLLNIAHGTYPLPLPERLADLPFLGALLKDQSDIEAM